MIIISEQKTKKLPGKTSLFISFNYNANIVDTLKQCYVYNYDKVSKIWEVPIPCLSYLIDNLSNYDEIKLELLQDIPEQKLKEFEIGPFKTTPFKHQLEAVQYGLNKNKWLLLDAPGLGKSKAMIDLANELVKKGEIQHCLIICGVNTLKYNWRNEVAIHSNLTARILGERINKKGRLVIGSVKDRIADLENPINDVFSIINIESLRDEGIVKALTKNKINKFDMIVFDECHCAKSPTAQQTKGLMKLDAKYKIAMTGTLLTNTPEDCFVPLKWIGEDNSTFTNFKYFYEIFGGNFGNELLGYRNINILKDQIDNCSLRRTKDLLDLPEKNIIHEFVEMESSQETFYNNIKQGIIDQVDKVHMSTANFLAMIARLRQATICPSILTTENIPSSKMDRAISLAKEIVSNGDKVLIFSSFKEPLTIAYEQLKQYNPVICTGDIKDEIVNENKNQFLNNPDTKIMLATIQKMGTGHTLTSARYMIFLDTMWTAALQEQAEDRIHRIGAKEPVFIYYIWTKDTIDERVKEILEDKEAISDYVVDDKITEKSLKSLQKYIEELK